jgi:diacylglycerol kinase (CTP)
MEKSMTTGPKMSDTQKMLNAPPALRHLDPIYLDNSEHRALPHRSMMHWHRKIFHMIGIGSVGLTLAFSSISTSYAIIILAIVSAIIIPLDYGRRFFPKFKEKVYKDFRRIMRDTERDNVTSMTWFLLSMLMTLAIAPREIAGLAALLLAFGDPWASIFGIRFGKTPLFGGKKTLEGFLGCFAVCTLVSILYFAFTGLVASSMVIPAAMLAGLAGALAESIPAGKLDDNFTIPLASAPALMGIVYLLA